MTTSAIQELRIVLTVDDVARELALWRDALGLELLRSWSDDTGDGALLAVPRATVELLARGQSDAVDALEAPASPSGPIRLAAQVADAEATAATLHDVSGAAAIGVAVSTPWGHRSQRVRTPDGVQLTLFTVR